MFRPAHTASSTGGGVALVHDYLTQRGGAERVVCSLLRAFPTAPLHTSLYEPRETFPELATADVRPLALNRLGFLRSDHRRALPLLSSAFRRLVVDSDVVVCSSSGWAHGVRTRGRKIVYCHNPARWLYQTSQYFGGAGGARRLALEVLRRELIRRDKSAASSAHIYLANSTAVRNRIRDVYGRESEVLHPPPALRPDGARRAVDGVTPGFFLCVSRLLPYKNVHVVVEAFRHLRDQRLIVVGSGPMRADLSARARANVALMGRVEDDELRWLYANCRGLVAASFEDFGLTPVEAAGFGRPSAVLRWGGFIDTVIEGRTGLFFDRPDAGEVAGAVHDIAHGDWDAEAICDHARRFSEDRFIARLHAIVGWPTRPAGSGRTHPLGAE